MLKKILKFNKKKDAAGNDVANLLQDAQTCLKSGHPDDAISIITNALESKEEKNLDAASMVALYETLTDMYRQQDNQKMVTATQRNLLSFVEKDAPELVGSTLPIKYELFKAGELRLTPDAVSGIAQLAYEQQEYEEVIKIVGKFAHNHPEHSDIGKNYLLVGKALVKEQKPEQAYRLLASLAKKYPQDAETPNVKQFLLEIKKVHLK